MLAHLEACARCRAEHDAKPASAVVAAIESDPLREAEPRRAARRSSRRGSSARSSGALAPGGPAPVVARGAARGGRAPRRGASLVPPLVKRLRPAAAVAARATIPPAEASPLLTEDALARIERNLAREHAARYLSEAGEVLVTVAATGVDCDRDRRAPRRGRSPRAQPRAAREAPTLVVDAGGEAVASARGVLDDVELALREVADLPSCVKRRDVERVQQRGGGAAAADADPPDDEGARGMRKRLAGACARGAACCPPRRWAQADAEALRAGEGALLRPAVRGGARRLAGDPATRAAAPTRRPRSTGSPAAARASARASARSASTARYLAAPSRRPRARRGGEDEPGRPRGEAGQGRRSRSTRRSPARRSPTRTARCATSPRCSSPRSARSSASRRCRCCRRSSRKEKDEDLVERAKLALLRLDRNALAGRGAGPAREAERPRGGLGPRAHLREGRIEAQRRDQPAGGARRPRLQGLPDEAIADLRKEGYDARSVLGAAQEDGAGGDPHDRRQGRRAHPGLDRVGRTGWEPVDAPIQLCLSVVRFVVAGAVTHDASGSSRRAVPRPRLRLPAAAAGSADDDLQAVKKAVLASSVSQARPPAEDPGGASAEAKPRRARKGEPSGSACGSSEKAGKRATRLGQPAARPRPLARRRAGRFRRPRLPEARALRLTIGEVLRALDSGPEPRRDRGRRGDRPRLGGVSPGRPPRATGAWRPPAAHRVRRRRSRRLPAK